MEVEKIFKQDEEKNNLSGESQETTEECKETDQMLAGSGNTSDTKAESGENTSEKIIKRDLLDLEGRTADKESVKTSQGVGISENLQADLQIDVNKMPVRGFKMLGLSKSKRITETIEGENADLHGKSESTRLSVGGRLRRVFLKKQLQKTIDEDVEINNAKNDAGQNKGLLKAFKLPIVNVMRKKDGEGLKRIPGPKNKAGLASMETLDDSLKDQDVVDRARTKEPQELEKDSKTDGIKQQTENHNSALWNRVRAYKCTVDDLAISGGILTFLILVAIISIFAFTSEPLKSAPIRDGRFVEAVTLCGLVEGMMEDGAVAFRGIPYAVPPINEHRWKPAKLLENIDGCWNGTLKAHNSSEVCAQILGNGTQVGVEDCLTLDVITPYVRYYNPLPVIVLIGAESLTGYSPDILRPSARFARSRDVLYVRPNFRLGPFGFLALQEFSMTAYPRTSGNYALSDILAVLNWIKLNIAHFGGDPKSVTLFGHRSGGTLVSLLVTSPLIKDLYTRAWVSSSAAIYPGRPLSEYEKQNLEFLEHILCNNADCMRNASTELVLDAVPDTWRRDHPDLPKADESTTDKHEWLVLDGHILRKHPADVWNNVSGKPKLVIGTTAHESHSEKLYKRYKEWTPDIVEKHIEKSKIGALNLTKEVLHRYTATYHGLVSMISDIRTICPSLINAKLQPSVPFYVVTQTDPQYGLADVDADVQAILGRYNPHTPEQRRYVAAIQSMFYHFVSHGEMREYNPSLRVIIVGQDALPFEEYPNCDFWISHDLVPRHGRRD